LGRIEEGPVVAIDLAREDRLAGSALPQTVMTVSTG
jgi:hypothetical protein